MWQAIYKAVEETLVMVFVSGFLGALFGIPLGVVLCVSKTGHILENKAMNLFLGTLVNATRSIPFIILMIAIVPFTRFVAGTAIGTLAAIVPLSVAAIPFIARMAEASMSQVPWGLIEAAQAMGASPNQIVSKVILAESRARLTNDITVTMINLVGYSAMAGAIGGGGLGTLAIQYGYQRFDAKIMLMTVIILIAMVQLMQWFGDYMVKLLDHQNK